MVRSEFQDARWFLEKNGNVIGFPTSSDKPFDADAWFNGIEYIEVPFLSEKWIADAIQTFDDILDQVDTPIVVDKPA